MEPKFRIRVEQALDERVRPYLMDHEGDIKIISYDEGVLHVQLIGQCCGCPAANITTEEVVKKELMDELPEIKDVILDDGITEDMIAFAKQLLSKSKSDR